MAAAATAQRHRAIEQWRRATAAGRARQRLRAGAEALVHPLRVGSMAGRWLGTIVGAFTGNKGGRGLLNRCSKYLDSEARCREMDRATAELDETRARIRAAVVDPLDAPRGARWQPLPAGGHQLVRGEATGNTHWLHQGFDSPGVRWADAVDGVRLGYLRVPKGQSALLLHTDEHGANGIGAGTYAIHRKRTHVPSVGMTPRERTTQLVED